MIQPILRVCLAALILAALPATVLASPPPSPEVTDGTATWYGAYFHGRPMANGETFNMWDPTTTAANVYPLGTWLRVTNLDGSQSVVVRVTDTGSFHKINPTTVVDLSYAAFASIADPDTGRIPVRVEPASPRAVCLVTSADAAECPASSIHSERFQAI